MKAYKKEEKWSYSVGVYPTLELLKTHADKVTKVLIHSKGDKNSGLEEINEMCGHFGIETEIADNQIEKIAKSENVYAIGIFNKYESPIVEGNRVVLVNPADKGNLGTIIRTMVGFGVGNLEIISPAVDIFDPKVIRASMGSVFRIKWEYKNTFEERENTYMFMSDKGKKLKTVLFRKPWRLVFGNEGAGLPEEFRNLGEVVTIEQTEEVDSLNLATAAAVGIYTANI